MNFKIKWGSFLPLLKKKHITEQEIKSPIFYFENEIELFVYQANSGYTVYSSIVIDEKIESVKMEFLSDAIELLEKPSDKSTLVFRQE